MTGGLQAEIKQSKPFETLETEALLSIARTAALIEHGLAQALKPYGLTPTQYNVLRILRGAAPEGLCRHEIAVRMVTPVPDVTRLLDRMEEAGLTMRQRGSADRRYVTARITRQGRELLASLDQPIESFNRTRLGHLGQRNLEILIETLAAARRVG